MSLVETNAKSVVCIYLYIMRVYIYLYIYIWKEQWTTYESAMQFGITIVVVVFVFIDRWMIERAAA